MRLPLQNMITNEVGVNSPCIDRVITNTLVVVEFGANRLTLSSRKR